MANPNEVQSTPSSPWNYKPWWCQPWSILLTGIVLIGGSWGLFHTLWFTGLVAVPVAAWMGFFLLLYPRLMQRELLSPDAEDAGEGEQLTVD